MFLLIDVNYMLHIHCAQKIVLKKLRIAVINFTPVGRVAYIQKVCGPTNGTAVTLKTGRREGAGSNPCRACRPSRSEFPVVFSETRVNTG